MIKICTPEKPYTTQRDGKQVIWQHSNAHETGEQQNGYPSGDIVTMLCDNCGVTWEKELPQ